MMIKNLFALAGAKIDVCAHNINLLYYKLLQNYFALLQSYWLKFILHVAQLNYYQLSKFHSVVAISSLN